MVAALTSSIAAIAFVRTRRPEPMPLDARLRETVTFLASDSLGGRAAGSDGETRAAQFIARAFDAIGLETPPGGRLQPFSFEVEGRTIASAGNVVGVLDVGAPRTFLIGAHYEHLGNGGPLSREPFTQSIHNGADDNASGVAMLLAIADRYASGERTPPGNLIFVAFSGEEEGLFGSRAFVAADRGERRIDAVLNFDMVGRLDRAAPVLQLEGADDSPFWAPVLARVRPPPFEVRTGRVTDEGSDHVPFYERGIPALSFSTGQTRDYHRSTDDVERINFEGMREITAYALEVLDALVPR